MHIKARIEEFCTFISSNSTDAQMAAREKIIVANLVKAAAKYVDIVVNQGITIQIGEADNRTLAEMDSRRSRVHDSLIAQISIVNRLCEKHGVAHVYQGPDERRTKGDFAMELINEYFLERV